MRFCKSSPLGFGVLGRKKNDSVFKGVCRHPVEILDI